MRKSKRLLLALTAVGALAIAGAGAGTFATFSAQVTNSNNTFATGALSLSDQANNTGTTCYSSGTTANDVNTNSTNANSECTALITSATPLAPSGAPYFSRVQLTNIGNLPGALSFWGSSPVSTTLTNSTGLSTTTTTSSLSVSALALPMTAGDSLTLISGTNTQTVTLASSAAINATTLTVSSFTPNYAYASGTEVIDTSALSCVAGAGQDTSAGVFTGKASLCGGLSVALYKDTSTTSPTPAVGDPCVWGCTGTSPTWGATNTTLSAAASGTVTSLSVASATGFSAGDSIVLTDNSQTPPITQTLTVTGVSANTLTVSSATLVGSFSTSTTVVDATTSESSFSGNYLSALPASTSPVTLTTSASPLQGSSSAEYYLAIYFPNTSTSGAQNQFMNEDVHFSLTWHLEQTTS